MTQRQKTSVTLLFAGETRNGLIGLSQQVSRITPSTFILGPQTPPHVTLFSFLNEEEEAFRIPPKMFPVSFTGLMHLGDQQGRVWVALGIKKTEALVQLRADLVAALGKPKLTREEFNPHVTLGNVVSDQFAKIDAAFALGGISLKQMSNIPCKTAMYVTRV